MSNIIKYSNGKDENTNIDDGYRPEYAKQLLEYVENNGNWQGFYYKIRITDKISNSWCEKHEDWQKAVDLIEFAKQYCIDTTLNTALDRCIQFKDLGAVMTLLLKRVDLMYKTDKDSGILKMNAQEKRINGKSKKSDINVDELLTQAQDLLNKED